MGIIEQTRPRRVTPATAIALPLVAILLTPATAADAVRATRATEISPAAASGWLAWTQVRDARPRFTAFARAAGGSPFKVNAAGTKGFTAGGAIDGTTLAYWQRKGRRGNIKFFDLEARSRSNPPDGVNTAKHEWGASLSGDWLLFARTSFGNNTEAIILFNLATGNRRKLDAGRGRVYAQPGTVAGDYATWIKCRRFTNCRTFRYQISSSSKSRLPNPASRSQMAASVTADGTVFYAESGSAINCKSPTRLYRVPPGGGRSQLLSMRRGRSISVTSPVERASQRVDIYYDRIICRNFESDIYKVSTG